MNDILLYTAFIVFALAGDTFFLAIKTGVVLQNYSAWLDFKAAFVFSFTQLVMAILGINIGFIISEFIPDFSRQVGLILVAFVGLKLILETYKINDDPKKFMIENTKTLWGLSFSASFNAFLSYLGLGLILTQYTMSPVIVLPILIFIIAVIGIFVGNKYNPEHIGNFSKYFGGFALILISIFLLFK